MKISVDKNKYLKYKINYLDNKIDELIDNGEFNKVTKYQKKKDNMSGGSIFGKKKNK